MIIVRLIQKKYAGKIIKNRIKGNNILCTYICHGVWIFLDLILSMGPPSYLIKRRQMPPYLTVITNSFFQHGEYNQTRKKILCIFNKSTNFNIKSLQTSQARNMNGHCLLDLSFMSWSSKTKIWYSSSSLFFTLCGLQD